MAIEAKVTIEARGEAEEVGKFMRTFLSTSTLQTADVSQQPLQPFFDADDDKKKQQIVNAMKQFNQHGILLIVSVLIIAKVDFQREDDYSFASFSRVKEWYEDKELDINERQISNRIGALKKQTSKLEIAPMISVFKDSFESVIHVPTWVEDIITLYAHEIGADNDNPEGHDGYINSTWHQFLCEIYDINLVTDEQIVGEDDVGLDALRNFISIED